MVAAGVYLVARLHGFFGAHPLALQMVAVVGMISAVMAASIACVMNDIKRVLAYSTISQLGLMMLSLGVGGYTAGSFHLMTHAFFKALLFRVPVGDPCGAYPGPSARWAGFFPK